ncbi:MAG: hypothetical protein ACREDH_14405 [Methylocella sp.]
MAGDDAAGDETGDDCDAGRDKCNVGIDSLRERQIAEYGLHLAAAGGVGRNQDEGGTGLGLAIALDIARSHGDGITLGDSKAGAAGNKPTVSSSEAHCETGRAP